MTRAGSIRFSRRPGWGTILRGAWGRSRCVLEEHEDFAVVHFEHHTRDLTGRLRLVLGNARVPGTHGAQAMPSGQK